MTKTKKPEHESEPELQAIIEGLTEYLKDTKHRHAIIKIVKIPSRYNQYENCILAVGFWSTAHIYLDHGDAVINIINDATAKEEAIVGNQFKIDLADPRSLEQIAEIISNL